MRRLSLIGTFLLLTSIVLMSTTTGCKDTKAPPPPPPSKDKGDGKTDGGEKKAEAGKKTAVPGGDGVIKGKVVFAENPPECKTLAEIEKTKGCKAPDNEQHQNCDQKWIVGKDKGVANVVVFLKPAADQYFDPSEADRKRTDTVEMDQPYCNFVPHVVALYPSYYDGKAQVKTGQKFVVKNSAEFPHNTKVVGNPLKNKQMSETLKPKGEKEFDLKPQDGTVNISCDIHPWMNAKAYVFDHPYAAVTKEDGSFEIKNVPNDVKLQVVAWHEVPGNFSTQDVTLKKGESKDLDLKIAPK